MTIQTLPIAQLRKDPRIQQRTEIDQAVVELYVEGIQAGDVFPPMVAFFDGTAHWLTAGFHREAAYQAAGVAEAQVEVREGTVRDAILFAVGDNATHGKQRTNEDKRRAVMTLLEDAEWAAWTDSEIARRCRVDHKTVAKHRASLGNSPVSRTYTTRHGTVATMDTAGISAANAQRAEGAAGPESPMAQVAGRDASIYTAPPAPADAPAPAAPPPPPAEPELEGPSDEELMATMAEHNDKLAALEAIVDADDKLAAAVAENVKLREQNRILQARVLGLTNEAAQAIRLAKSWRLKCERAGK